MIILGTRVAPFALPQNCYQQLLEDIHNFAVLWTKSFLHVN